MSEEQKHIESIDRYLKGDMSPEEQRDFESQLEQDADLKNLFEFTRDADRAIEVEELKKLKSGLQKMDKGAKTRKSYLWVKVAASVLFMVVLGYLVLQNKLDKNALYEAYYEPYPNIAEPISRSQGSAENAYQLYESGNYEDALKLLEARTEKSDTTIFYIGQSHMAQGDLEAADAKFIMISKESPFFQPAQWYTALIALKTQDRKVYVSKLSSIAKSGNSYSTRAKEILETL